MTVFTFENNGYQVTRCNKETALEDISALQPHIIVIGYTLGGVSGNDVCVKLKENNFTGQIPIILYSVSKNISDISQGSCADGFIGKPLELDDFIYLVHRIALS